MRGMFVSLTLNVLFMGNTKKHISENEFNITNKKKLELKKQVKKYWFNMWFEFHIFPIICVIKKEILFLFLF